MQLNKCGIFYGSIPQSGHVKESVCFSGILYVFNSVQLLERCCDRVVVSIEKFHLHALLSAMLSIYCYKQGGRFIIRCIRFIFGLIVFIKAVLEMPFLYVCLPVCMNACLPYINNITIG